MKGDHITFRVAFGGRVRRLRERVGLTQNEVGEALGLTRQAMSMVEAGRSGVLAEYIPILCDALAVSPTKLFALERAERKAGLR